MRIVTIIVVSLAVAGCRQPDTPKQINAEIRIESEEFTKPRVGKIRIDTTYRGDERILMVMSYSNVTTRTFCLHGTPMYVESDEDGDGLFESLMISGETTSDFEQFRRLPDGAVEPISKEEYLELRRKVDEATERMSEAFRQAKREME